MEIQAGKTHPMIIVAATAVTIASAAAIASFAGWLPGSKDSGATTPQTQMAVSAPVAAPLTAPTPVPAPATASEKPSAPRPAPATRKLPRPVEDAKGPAHAPVMASGGSVYAENAVAQQPPYPPVCANCATVEGIREVKQEGDGTGLGAIGGGVLGGLLGNQIGNGRGRTLGAVVGAVGGAYAGNEVEKNVRSSNHFEITVRLDNGNTRVFKEAQRPSWQRGDRVRIENGQLIRM
jgi:outer membrane lipoprotein SlyB